MSNMFFKVFCPKCTNYFLFELDLQVFDTSTNNPYIDITVRVYKRDTEFANHQSQTVFLQLRSKMKTIVVCLLPLAIFLKIASAQNEVGAYHFHTYFFQDNQDSKQIALNFRYNFIH